MLTCLGFSSGCKALMMHNSCLKKWFNLPHPAYYLSFKSPFATVSSQIASIVLMRPVWSPQCLRIERPKLLVSFTCTLCFLFNKVLFVCHRWLSTTTYTQTLYTYTHYTHKSHGGALPAKLQKFWVLLKSVLKKLYFQLQLRKLYKLQKLMNSSNSRTKNCFNYRKLA